MVLMLTLMLTLVLCCWCLLLFVLQKELKRPMLIPPSDFGPKFKDTIR